jgi:hypothetical protein
VSDHRVKISVKSDHHALQNLRSNPTDKVTEFDSNYQKFENEKNPIKIRKFDFLIIYDPKLLETH